MYCMAHDCFYPALGLFLAMRVAYKVHFEEKVLNCFITQEQNDR